MEEWEYRPRPPARPQWNADPAKRERPSADNTMTWELWRSLNKGVARRSQQSDKAREQWKAFQLQDLARYLRSHLGDVLVSDRV